MIKKILIFILLVVIQVNSQNLKSTQLDSVYNLYLNLRGITQSEKVLKKIEIDPAIRKCGMVLVQQLKSNLSAFSVEQQTLLSKILQRPSLPLSIVSPKGFFRIHYSTSGTDAIAYDVNLLAQALDSAYTFEVGYLGYPPPPSDGSEGGDGKYDVYVRNLGNLYGQTTSENNVSTSRWTSYMEMDNDFSGFYTTGINAARVTAAHEFHHAIQMGNYAPENNSSPFRDSDVFFYELTSTSMEEFVFDTINDYYAYMPEYFRNPARPFPSNSGYDLAIWNIYLKDIFGFSIIKRQWELMPTIAALNAINQSIIEKGSSTGLKLNEFGIWTYYTKNRAINGKYFKEAANYPLIDPTTTVNFSGSSQLYNMSLGPTGNYFFQVNLPGSDGTLVSIISNSDIQKAIENPNQTFGFNFTVYNSFSGSKPINDKYSITFSRQDQNFWNNTGILNDIIVYSDSTLPIPNLQEDVYSYPSPFRYSQFGSRGIKIAFTSDKNTRNEIYFNVYSTNMQLVYQKNVTIERSYVKNSKNYFEFSWDGLDLDNKHLASGVYLFFIKIDSDIKKGKLVIFND